jgi:HSP20 family protein
VFVDAELPGFRKDEIDLTLEGGVLTITAERKQEPKKTEHLTERRYTRVQRSFALPTSVDESAVDAKLEGGVLKLKLAKHDEVKPHKIEVK